MTSPTVAQLASSIFAAPGQTRHLPLASDLRTTGEDAAGGSPAAGCIAVEPSRLCQSGATVDRGSRSDESIGRRREYRRILGMARAEGVTDADLAVIVVRIGATDPEELTRALDPYRIARCEDAA